MNRAGARIDCVATGNPPPSVEWLDQEGTPLSPIQKVRQGGTESVCQPCERKTTLIYLLSLPSHRYDTFCPTDPSSFHPSRQRLSGKTCTGPLTSASPPTAWAPSSPETFSSKQVSAGTRKGCLLNASHSNKRQRERAKKSTQVGITLLTICSGGVDAKVFHIIELFTLALQPKVLSTI